jgi:ABC-type multidrug transport system permease subunit
MITDRPGEIRPLSPVRELAAVWMFVKRDLLLQTHFKASYLTGLLTTVSSLVIYGMIARFGASVPEIQAMTGNYIDFVISGMVLNTLLTTALSGPYNGLMESFWNNRTEMIMASPLRLPLFIVGLSAGRYVDTCIRMGIYVAGGLLFFGLTRPPLSGLLETLAVVLPALLACTGLGLAAASMIYTLDARGGQDPIRFVIETISGLVAGVYIPLQALPVWAQALAHLVPHTYAIDGMRRALFGETALPLLPVHRFVPLSPVALDALILAVYGLIILPVGWRMFRHGVDLARSDGRLSRWL